MNTIAAKANEIFAGVKAGNLTKDYNGAAFALFGLAKAEAPVAYAAATVARLKGEAPTAFNARAIEALEEFLASN